jgi:hypothetical protein
VPWPVHRRAVHAQKRQDFDFRPYRNLGRRAIHATKRRWPKTGSKPRCPGNAIIQQRKDGKVEVPAVDSVALMMVVENPKLAEATTGVR